MRVPLFFILGRVAGLLDRIFDVLDHFRRWLERIKLLLDQFSVCLSRDSPGLITFWIT